MSPEPSIQCAKCAKPGTDNDARCSQCGGTLVRVCGDCQFKNSIAKRFCDRCGSRLRPDTTFRRAAKSGGRPGEGREPQNPAAPGATLGTGMDPFRGSAQQQQQAKPARPQGPVYRPSGNSEVSPSRNPTTFSSRSGPGPISSLIAALGSKIERVRAGSRWGSLLLTVIACASGVYGSIMIGLQLYRILTPDAPVMFSARAYLDALGRRDFSGAYEMLSATSKAQSSRAEFARLKELPSWEYTDLNLISLEGSLAVLQYSLKGIWQKPQEQVLVFMREKGKWVVDRDRDLLARIEDAFDHRDVAEAYRLSVLAAQTHKWDPLAHAYLCEAAYARRLRSEAELHCRQALEASGSIPYRLTAATRKHVSMIIADIANDEKRYTEAAGQYSALLSSSGLLQDERCRLLLARADDGMAASQFSQALKDLQGAESYCKMAEEKSYISRCTGILEGSAGSDAVALVKNHTINADGETLLDWSRDKGNESWSPEHLGGTKYKVSLKSSGGVIVSALVDLWTRNVESTQPEVIE